MDNYGIFLRKMIEIVAFGDTIIVNYQLSIVHYLALQRSDKLVFEEIF